MFYRLCLLYKVINIELYTNSVLESSKKTTLVLFIIKLLIDKTLKKEQTFQLFFFVARPCIMLMLTTKRNEKKMREATHLWRESRESFFQHFISFFFSPSLVTVVHDVVFSFNFTSHTITVQNFFSSYEFFNFSEFFFCGSKCLDEIFLCLFIFFESEIFCYTKKIFWLYQRQCEAVNSYLFTFVQMKYFYVCAEGDRQC